MAARVLVTAALPYANGSIHLGHMLEFIQTDVYVRARRLAGEDVVFMWADDTHGTAIQLRAGREGITPEALIERAHAEHRADFDDFGIGYDIFYTTHSEENRRHAYAIFEAMQARGDIVTRAVEQLYCPQDRIFLPDRFVQGICPHCRAADQYGDVCESCSKTYDPTDLLEPRCSQCGAAPELRSSEHLFVPLSRHQEFLRDWLTTSEQGGQTRLQASVRNSLSAWLDDLRDWDISREAPYFGFEIPGHPGKYFYVWFDAPIGYIAATDRWCADHGEDFAAYWKSTRDETEIVHVIGKDIVYFHCLFWPAMLAAAGYTVPSRVQVHGWLTVNGHKMSKSRGTFILARTYLDHLPPEYLRYYFAAKLGASQDDFDLSMEDFANRVNADLVNKAANLASRSIKFLHGKLGGRTGECPEEAAPMLADAREKLALAPARYRDFEYAQALRSAMEIAEACNVYLTEKEPWKLAQRDPEAARAICSVGVQISKIVAGILTPVLPAWGAKMARMLGMREPLSFVNAGEAVPAGTVLGEYELLAERLDPAKLDAIIAASMETIGAPAGVVGEAATAAGYEVEPLADASPLAALAAVDLRVARIVECERVEGSDKLLRIVADLGPLGRRQVFSGIAKSYAPEQLVGLHVVVFANLEPRKMRFGVSEGMIMAAGRSDDAVTVLTLDPRSLPGDKVS